MANCHITYVECMNQIISQNPGPFALIYRMSINYLGENDLPIKYVFCDITTPTVPNLTCIMEMYHVLDSPLNSFSL